MNKEKMLNESNARLWNAFDDLEIAKEAILTGYSKTGNFHTTVLTDEYYTSNRETCLDFGCGVGRNFPILTEKYKVVHGFDLPKMLKLMPEEEKTKVELISDNWEEIRIKKYDVIHACIVLQHIDEDYLRAYLEDFTNMSDSLILSGRSYLDDYYKNVLKIVLDYYEVVTLSDDLQHCLTADIKEHLHYCCLLKRK